MNFEKICRDHGIPHVTEGHKHCRPGWIQVVCPFCAGNPGYHLGFNEERAGFHCWRCGSKKTIEVLIKILRISGSQAFQILAKYKGSRRRVTNAPTFERRSKVSYPMGTCELNPRAAAYLSKRKYNAESLQKIWGLRSTGPTGPYKFRIIAPIYQDGVLVSYQGRDYTNKQDPPYKACSQEDEVEDHKHCLYGLDLFEGDSVVVVEGIADVWRLGPGAVATFGIKFTNAQVSKLMKFKKVFIFFDSDPQAIVQARKLAMILSAFCEVEILVIENGDPGNMSQEKADKLMGELL